jgi:cell division protein FtsB
MKENFKTKLGNFFNQFLIYLLLIYTFIMLGRVIYLNYQLNKQTDQMKSDILKIEQQNKNLANLNIYYQSDSFKEVEARRTLGLVKPGEKVALVPVEQTPTDFNTQVQNQAAQIAPKEKVEINKNYQLWWQYFFK